MQSSQEGSFDAFDCLEGKQKMMLNTISLTCRFNFWELFRNNCYIWKVKFLTTLTNNPEVSIDY